MRDVLLVFVSSLIGSAAGLLIARLIVSRGWV